MSVIAESTAVKESVPSLRKRTIRGLFWQGLSRGGDRLARLGTNIVLARLLSPDDFGLMGIVATALAPLDAITFVATGQAIIQSPSGRRSEFLETAFWVALGRGFAIAILCVVLAPIATWYFERPDALPLFLAMAAQPILQGLASPKAQLLVKDMQFGRWSTFQIMATLIGMVASIALAFTLRNAWALLLGQLLTVFAQCIGSHLLAPIRLTFRVSREALRELRQFVSQAAGTPVLLMLINQAPALLLAKVSGLTALGTFVMARGLVSIPTELSNNVLSAVLFPLCSAMQHDRVALGRVWLHGLRLLAVPLMLLGVLMAWVGAELPALAWGAEYRVDSATVAALAAAAVLSAFVGATGPLFWGSGHPRIDRAVQLLRALVVYSGGIAIVGQLGQLGMAIALVAGLIVGGIYAFRCAVRLLGLGPRELPFALMPALSAGMALAIALLGIDFIIRVDSWNRLGVGLTATILVLLSFVPWFRRNWGFRASPQAASAG